MSGGPTQGARELNAHQWQRSPVLAGVIRAVVVVIPFLTAWSVVSSFSDAFIRPGHRLGIVAWILQAAATGTAVAMVTERFTRRLLPLATLFNLSLVFPVQAPSRFSVALRSGTLTRLQARVDEVNDPGLGPDHGQAAARAVELVGMIGKHDRLTRGHTERVRAYSDMIAAELGVSGRDRARLSWGSMLHDVGKLTVPAEILNKAGRPTEAEWSILRHHPMATAEMLEPLNDWLGEWVRAGAEHHERWDGTGYPLGLVGTEISLAGRITAVADAYDVITSKRSYKAPMSPAAARRELVDCAGTQFDPDVVRAFLTVSIGHRWFTGPVAWIAEVPRLASLCLGPGLSSAPGVIAGVIVAAGTAIIAPPVRPMIQPEPIMAFTDDVRGDQPAEVTTTLAQDDVSSGRTGTNLNLYVLSNDVPPSGFDYPTLQVVTPPENGTATPHFPGNPARSRIMYQSNDGYTGTDQFVYRICDTNGSCATATATMTVTP